MFIGYPVWTTNAPQATFLSQYNWSDKTIVPFCTHNGYDSGESYEDIAEAVEGEAAVLEGLAVEVMDVSSAMDTVSQWLQYIGIDQQTDGTAETASTISAGDMVLNGMIYDTDLNNEIQEYFPLTVSIWLWRTRVLWRHQPPRISNVGSYILKEVNNGEKNYCNPTDGSIDLLFGRLQRRRGSQTQLDATPSSS